MLGPIHADDLGCASNDELTLFEKLLRSASIL